MKVPQHIAIILDGNGRWAKAKGMPRNYGHAQGSKNVERICEEAWRMGIKYLTVYAFSTENWSRPSGEVAALMKLLRNYMKTCLKTAEKNDMKIRVIGDIEPLDEDIKSRIKELEAATAQMTELMNMDSDSGSDEEEDALFTPGGAATMPVDQMLGGQPGENGGYGAGVQQKKESFHKKKRKHIQNFCTDLTAKARAGQLDNIIGREKEIQRALCSNPARRSASSIIPCPRATKRLW